jgi:dUTP pyrophosphatase
MVKTDDNLEVKLHLDTAQIPTRGSPDVAGYDLYSAEDKIVPAHGKMIIDTQISIATPPGTYGCIAPRSGLAAKNMITMGARVIDADYRGIVFVLLFNHSDKDLKVEKGIGLHN